MPWKSSSSSLSSSSSSSQPCRKGILSSTEPPRRSLVLSLPAFLQMQCNVIWNYYRCEHAAISRWRFDILDTLYVETKIFLLACLNIAEHTVCRVLCWLCMRGKTQIAEAAKERDIYTVITETFSSREMKSSLSSSAHRYVTSLTSWFAPLSVSLARTLRLRGARALDTFLRAVGRWPRGYSSQAGTWHVWNACPGWCLNNRLPPDIYRGKK